MPTGPMLETFDRHRPLLFSIARRMLGSAMDAEDVVQEAYPRRQGAEEEVRSTKAYLSTVVARLSIDRRRSARARRELGWTPSIPAYRDGTRILQASPQRAA